MLIKRIQMLLVSVIMAVTVHASAATVLVLDSIGRMPEITVTAPRYENQDEAWAGLVEGIIVEAQRLPMGTEATAVRVNCGNISTDIDGGDSIYGGAITGLLGIFTLILAMMSIMYVSLRAFLIAKEVHHE